MSKNFNMFSDLKEIKFNTRKQQNSTNDTDSTVDSSIESKPSLQLINFKLIPLLRNDIGEQSENALKFIYKKFNIKPVNYLTNKSVVLFQNETKKVVVKFVYKFEEELKEHPDNVLQEMINNERNIITLKHKNIWKVSCYCSDVFGYSIYVSDFLPNRDLKIFTQQFYENKLTKLGSEETHMGENMIRYFAIQIVDVLAYLEGNNIAHLNLTPCHFLVHSNFQIKLIDFSCSRYSAYEMLRITKNIKIDTDYQPNEYFTQGYLDFRNAHKIDVYSFGCILYFLATGKTCPRVNNEEYSKFRDILSGILKYKYSDDFVDLIYSTII
jgi:serine/threonine protein kinase